MATAYRGISKPLIVCIIFAVLIALILLASGPTLASVLSDTKGHWAETSISSLMERGVIRGYPDGTFKPDTSITRAEFASLVAKAFGYAPSERSGYPDMENHWAKPFVSALSSAGVVEGYPNGRYEPDRSVSRAEAVTMLARVAKVAEISAADAASWPPSFRDVDAGHWAFRYVEMARRLDIVPLHFGLAFQPDRQATRAEMAHMVDALSQAQFARGTVSAVSPTVPSLVMKSVAGESQTIFVEPDTVVMRNGVSSSIEDVRKNDSVFIIGTRYGSPRFIMAEGLVTREDVTRKVSQLTKGVLTSEQIDLIARGKWNEARDGLAPALVGQLEELGLTTEEATALLSQEWSKLPDFGKKRVAEAISNELGVSIDLAEAVMNRDWEAARLYAQLDAAQLLLTRFLKY